MEKCLIIGYKDRKDKMELEPITHLPHPPTTDTRLWNTQASGCPFLWCGYDVICTQSWSDAYF